jgi:hypothetical protein
VFGDQIALDSFAIEPDRVMRSGETIAMTAAWRAVRVPDEDYVRFFHLYGADGRRWLQLDGRPGGGVSAPTTWEEGAVYPDRVRGVLPLDLPAGAYRLEAGWYEPGGGPRMAVGGASTYLAKRIVVLRDVTPPGQLVGAEFGEWARLEGWDLGPDGLRLVWRAHGPSPQPMKVFVHVVDREGRMVAQSDGDPGGIPTDLWPPGAPIEDLHRLVRSDGAIRVGLYDPITGRRALVAGGEYVTLAR